jgi:hypothetical protein
VLRFSQFSLVGKASQPNNFLILCHKTTEVCVSKFVMDIIVACVVRRVVFFIYFAISLLLLLRLFFGLLFCML